MTVTSHHTVLWSEPPRLSFGPHLSRLPDVPFCGRLRTLRDDPQAFGFFQQVVVTSLKVPVDVRCHRVKVDQPQIASPFLLTLKVAEILTYVRAFDFKLRLGTFFSTAARVPR